MNSQLGNYGRLAWIRHVNADDSGFRISGDWDLLAHVRMVPGDRIARRVYSDSVCWWPPERVAANAALGKKNIGRRLGDGRRPIAFTYFRP